MIDYNAFAGCTGLKDISLKRTYDIRENAFARCSNLKTVYFGYNKPGSGLTNAVATIAASAFYENIRKTSGYVMKGYDDNYLKDYAARHYYTYETLNEVFTVSKKGDGDATISTSPAKILPGQKVTVTVKPKSGFSLTNFTVQNADGTDFAGDVSLESFDRTSVVFSFEMPRNNVDVIPVTTATAKLPVNNLVCYLTDDAENIKDDEDDGSYIIESNERYQINIKNSSGGDTMLPKWLWSYSSNKPAVVSVTNTGVITTLAPGTAVITSRLLSGKGTVQFTVHVDNELDIRKITVKGSAANPRWTGGIIAPPGKDFTGNTKTVDGVDYPLIKIARSLVSVEDIKVKINIDAFSWDNNALGNTSRIVKSAWSSNDTSIVTVASANSTTNSNTITIKKGSYGEASVAISTLNNGETKVNSRDGEDNETFVMIQIWDDVPRIAEKEIVINAQKEENLVTLFNAYSADTGEDNHTDNGKVYDDTFFRVYYDREFTKPCNDFTIEYDSDSQRMNFVTTPVYDEKTPLNKTNTYKGLYMIVTLNGANGGTKHVIQLPNVKIENKALAPKLTSTGSLNLFYNTTNDATDAERGWVNVTQNLSTENLERIKLVSTDNYKKYGKRTLTKIEEDGLEDSLYRNFDVGRYARNSFVITRNNVYHPQKAPNYILTDSNGKAVTSGYAFLEFTGYKYPVIQSYTVPTVVTAPNYVLSATSGTAHTLTSNMAFKVSLLDRSRNNAIVHLQRGGADVFSGDNVGGVDTRAEGLTLDDDQTKNPSISKDNGDLRALTALDQIQLKYGVEPQAGKVVIRIHMKSWSDYAKTEATRYLRYAFTVSTTSAEPKITFDNAKPTFNIRFMKEKAEITATPPTNIGGITVKGFKNLSYTGSAATKAMGESLIVNTVNVPDPDHPVQFLEKGNADERFAADDGKLIITLPLDGQGHHTFKKGSYSYSVYPGFSFDGGATISYTAKPITFTVVVNDAGPVLKLSNSTFTINYLPGIKDDPNYKDTSFTQTTYTLTGLSANTVMNQYTLVMPAVSDANYVKVTANANSFGDLVDEDYSQPNNGAAFRLYRHKPSAAVNKAFSYVYEVRNATIKLTQSGGQPVADGPEAVLEPFKVTVKGVLNNPRYSVKLTDKLNFADSLSTVKYDFTIYDINGTLGDVVGLEEMNAGKTYEPSTHFEAYKIPTAPNRVFLKIKEPLGLKVGASYKLRMTYKYTAMGDALYQYEFNVSPTQSFPKLVTGAARNYIYAGEDSRAKVHAGLSRKISCTVSVPLTQADNYLIVSDRNQTKATNAAGTAYLDPEVWLQDGVRWAANTPDSYKRAFSISNVTCETETVGGVDYPTGKYTFDIVLKNAAAVVQNKEMTLNFLVYYKGQAINTNGSPISFKVTVRK